MSNRNIKILVFSDSHGKERNIEKAIKAHGGCADAMIFLGDGLIGANSIFAKYPSIPHISVRGNGDFNAHSDVDEAIVEFGGIKILCMHGHKYDVKSGLIRASYRASEKGADVLLFGHTHIPLELRSEKLILFNPGSIGRGYPDYTYGVLNISGKQIICGHGRV